MAAPVAARIMRPRLVPLNCCPPRFRFPRVRGPWRHRAPMSSGSLLRHPRRTQRSWKGESRMGKVIIGASVSVDGFIADGDDGVGPLFDWYFNGDRELPIGAHQYRPQGGYRPAERSAQLLRETWPRIGATIIGRRLFDLTD